MEPMKQCPNCGKYVAADRTYCMNCGTTLGVKCEACGKVVPLMTKVCPCGHSFVKKSKKVRKSGTLLPAVKKHARPILWGLVALTLILTVVFAALPALKYEVIETRGKEPVIHTLDASGFSVLGYFLGFDHDDIAELLDMKLFKDAVTPMKLLLYLEGLGWLALVAALLLLVILLLPNLKRLGKETSRRMIPLTATVLGGGAVIFIADVALRGIMTPIVAEKYTVEGLLPEEITTFWSVGTVFPILIFAVTVLLFGGHLFLHLAELRTREEADALALKTILITPYEATSRFVRKKIKNRRAKAKGKFTDDDEKSITCTSRFTTYLILLAVSLVFTQALLSKISNLFFWFMLLLPLPCLLYALIAKHTLTVTMISDTATTEKEQPYTYEFRIDNRSPLAFPFIDARVSIPQSNSVRCTDRSVRLSMAPMSSYHMKNTVRFRFRGTYEIGVRCFYVYDFFRLFSVRVPVENMTTVYVLPRRINLEDTLAQSVSDSTARTVRSPLVVDRLEVSDIRDYRNGDTLKSIHWKLSSKSETFVVKDYNTGTSNETVVFCDMAAHFPDEPPKAVSESIPAEAGKTKLTPAEKKAAREEAKAQKDQKKKQALQKKYRHSETDETHAISDEALEARLAQRKAVADLTEAPENEAETEIREGDANASAVHDVHRLAQPVYYEDMNEFLADGVVELTIASVLAELRQGHNVTLIWFDHRSDMGVYAYTLRGVEEFENIYHLFATAPLCRPDQRVCSLTAMISDIQSAKQLFVTSTMDSAMLSELTALPGVSDASSFGSAEVILYNPEDRFMYPTERTSYLEGCRDSLSAGGLSLRTSGMIAVRREGGETHEF